MYHPFYHIRSNELYTESSSPCHHQPGCENPHQFQQSVRESITVFVLVFLSDVVGVEVFLLVPTVSGDDDAGPRFCVPLPPSTPRFHGIALKTLDEFP
jgi:hypothetical protein